MPSKTQKLTKQFENITTLIKLIWRKVRWRRSCVPRATLAPTQGCGRMRETRGSPRVLLHSNGRVRRLCRSQLRPLRDEHAMLLNTLNKQLRLSYHFRSKLNNFD